MSLVDVATASDFDKHVGSGALVATHFWADWCEPCGAMDQLLTTFAVSHPTARFLKVEAETVDLLVERFDVNAVPFFTFHENGKLVDTLEGADAEQLAEKLNARLGSGIGGVNASSGAAAPAASAQEDLDARLKVLTTSASVLLFMKGSKQEPQCGFSRKVVGALGDTGVDFETFDILQDEDVRQGLKTFSDWPTYPQLYVNGELLGGCDIVLEMAANGELADVVKSASSAAKEPLETRLKSLINQANAVAFIKGNKIEQRCGFSRKVVTAMTETGHPFETFDILEDEEVRQGLKVFSDWPTYPQLYINGELVGGCDIILEMAGNGELKDAMA